MSAMTDWSPEVKREQAEAKLADAIRHLVLAVAAAPFVAAGKPKQEAFERVYDLFDDAEAFLRDYDERAKREAGK